MPNYIAVVHKEPASDYGVSFPDFPGCITAGKTIDAAKDLAYEALLLHLEGLREDGEPLPAPTNLEDIVADPENAEAVAFLVVSAPDAQVAQHIEAFRRRHAAHLEVEGGKIVARFRDRSLEIRDHHIALEQGLDRLHGGWVFGADIRLQQGLTG